MVGHRPAMMTALDKLAILNEGQLEACGPADVILSRLRSVARNARSGQPKESVRDAVEVRA